MGPALGAAVRGCCLPCKPEVSVPQAHVQAAQMWAPAAAPHEKVTPAAAAAAAAVGAAAAGAPSAVVAPHCRW